MKENFPSQNTFLTYSRFRSPHSVDFLLWIDSEIGFQLSKFWMECEAILCVIHVKLSRGFQLKDEISRNHVPLNY